MSYSDMMRRIPVTSDLSWYLYVYYVYYMNADVFLADCSVVEHSTFTMTP